MYIQKWPFWGDTHPQENLPGYLLPIKWAGVQKITNHVCRRVLSWIPWSSSPCCEPCMRCMSSLPRIAQLVFQQFPPFQRFLCYPPTSVAWHFSHHVLNWWKGKLCSQIRAKGALGSHWSQVRFPTTQVWFQKRVRRGFWLLNGLILKIRWNLCYPLESIHYPAFPHNNFFSFFFTKFGCMTERSLIWNWW